MLKEQGGECIFFWKGKPEAFGIKTELVNQLNKLSTGINEHFITLRLKLQRTNRLLLLVCMPQHLMPMMMPKKNSTPALIKSSLVYQGQTGSSFLATLMLESDGT